MAIVLVVVGVVVVYLLWRVMRAQETQAQVQAVRAAVETAVLLAPHIAAGFEQARGQGRLIEWTDAKARELGLDEATMRATIDKRESNELRALLVAESLDRGVLSRFLTARHCEPSSGYPGATPPSDVWCPSQCEIERDVAVPNGTTACPFCGGAIEPLSGEADREEWEREMLAWSRYAKIYPREAAAEEAERTAARTASDHKQRARYEAAVTAHRTGTA